MKPLIELLLHPWRCRQTRLHCRMDCRFHFYRGTTKLDSNTLDYKRRSLKYEVKQQNTKAVNSRTHPSKLQSNINIIQNKIHRSELKPDINLAEHPSAGFAILRLNMINFPPNFFIPPFLEPSLPPVLRPCF